LRCQFSAYEQDGMQTVHQHFVGERKTPMGKGTQEIKNGGEN